jgi:hypothetical protein
VDEARKNPDDYVARIRKKWEATYCSACGQVTDWTVAARVFCLMELKDGEVNLDGMVVPVVPVACHNCGYTILINALANRIVSPD